MDEMQRRLAMVPPEGRATVQRRTEVLKRYLGIVGPSGDDLADAASALGVRPENFKRLVRVWKEHRDPRMLNSRRGPDGPRGLEPLPGDDFVREVLAGLVEDRPANQDLAAILEAARRAGIALRSRPGLYRMVREWRVSRGRSVAAAKGLFVDHLVVTVAVRWAAGACMPVASVLGVGREILAVRIAIGRPSPSAVAELLAHADRLGVHYARPDGVIEVDGRLTDDWSAASAALAVRGLVRRGGDLPMQVSGRLGGEAVHPRLLGLRTFPQLINRPPGRRPPRGGSGLQPPLALGEARAPVPPSVAN